VLIVLCQASLSKKMGFKNYSAPYEVTFCAPHRRYCSCRMKTYWEAVHIPGAPRVTPRSISNNPLTSLESFYPQVVNHRYISFILISSLSKDVLKDLDK